MDAMTIVILLLLVLALLGFCMGRWGPAPSICLTVAVLLLAIVTRVIR